ncbi:MAG: serine/threonine-protein kinase [Gemmataceae bacterium]
MPRPDSVSDVLALVRRSGLVSEERLGRFLDLLRTAGMDDARAGGVATALAPTSVLSLMVEQGLLTRYQSHELAAGRAQFFIDGFRILELLGRGGMGHVFLAEHPRYEGAVALKVLSAPGEANEDCAERFVREARAACALNDPKVVRVLDVNVTHDPPYLVMEYVEGVSLQAAVARYGTFPPGEAAAIGAEVAAGLQSIAEATLVHRDIKPANILVDRAGRVKILDLGIARFHSDPTSRLADTQSVIGTLDYLAPEQAIDSSHVDVRADLYGLGATLFFMLAGHPPFADDEVNRKLVRKQQSNAPSIAALRLDIPEGFARVINRLLERSASDRYATPREAADALREFAAVPADYPQRLFRNWRSNADVPGQPTATGNDPTPTPLPPTRRILRSSTERRVAPPESMPDTTPLPASPPPVPDPLPLAMQETDLHESGSPTVTITAPVPPSRWRNLGPRFWLAAGALLIVALTAALAARSFLT